MLLFLFTSNVLYHFKIQFIDAGVPLNMNGDCSITLIPPTYKLNFEKINRENLKIKLNGGKQGLREENE